jgi:hypothetical protein
MNRDCLVLLPFPNNSEKTKIFGHKRKPAAKKEWRGKAGRTRPKNKRPEKLINIRCQRASKGTIMRNFITMAAVIGLGLAAAGGAQAGGRGASHSSPSHSPSSFNHSGSFNFSKYGVKSLSYSHRSWCDRYGCYQYWCPSSSCWYFYEPTCCYYVPLQYYTTVYVTPVVQPLLVSPAPTPVPLVAATGPVQPIGPPK